MSEEELKQFNSLSQAKQASPKSETHNKSDHKIQEKN